MTGRKKTICIAAAILLGFAVLLVTATFTDFAVSRALTKNVLPAGEYYADDVFGVAMECVGSAPELLIAALAAELLFLCALRQCAPGAGRTALLTLTFAAGAGVFLWMYREIFKYAARHFEARGNTAFLWGVSLFLALVSAVLCAFAVNNIPDAALKRLARFAVVSVCAIVLALIVVTLLKNPAGRMRYRAMNVIGDFSGYRAWYQWGGQPDKEWMKQTFGTADAFKSFPSGHTRAAAATFYLPVFAEALGTKRKALVRLLWIFAAVFTVAVAVSRIMVGAHFFSDVLTGGMIGFAFAMLARAAVLHKKPAQQPRPASVPHPMKASLTP